MCECGCNEMNPTQAFRIGSVIMVVDEYRGCKSCSLGICPTLCFFDSEQHAREWIGDMPIADIVADEYGVNGRVYIPIAGKTEMVKAAQELEETQDLSNYSGLANIMEDHGLRLLQMALRYREAPPKESESP